MNEWIEINLPWGKDTQSDLEWPEYLSVDFHDIVPDFEAGAAKSIEHEISVKSIDSSLHFDGN